MKQETTRKPLEELTDEECRDALNILFTKLEAVNLYESEEEIKMLRDDEQWCNSYR